MPSERALAACFEVVWAGRDASPTSALLNILSYVSLNVLICSASDLRTAAGFWGAQAGRTESCPQGGPCKSLPDVLGRTVAGQVARMRALDALTFTMSGLCVEVCHGRRNPVGSVLPPGCHSPDVLRLMAGTCTCPALVGDSRRLCLGLGFRVRGLGFRV